ncbi:hypothetical protein M0805_004117 [Coniferiporia weirii]|nr:hypothetical protein M0805_004117 [Coniferiporia weirii]
MGLRPATPGFIVTLIATILLAIVTFNVPFIKSVYFLQASLTVDNVNGTITLGTLGYCIDLSTNGTTCSKASVGYEFNPNALLGDDVSFAQIPTVVVKWITYALFLHAIALAVAAVSALFGLLAHVREMSMTCCSTFVSGFAAIITLVAFVFDIVLFFIVKERIKSIDGTATFGTAVWLTLASWILLFFSGCVYACGRCCISRRQRGGAADNDGRLDQSWMGRNGPGAPGAGGYAEQMRLDAVKAEADRKARQKGEIGLPPFPGHDATQPLNSTKPQYLEDESDDEAGVGLPYRDQGRGAAAMGPRMQGQQQQQQQQYRGGYAQAPPGTRAVDEYYSPTRTEANVGYPPNRQYAGSASAGARSPPPSTYATSMYSSSAATTAGAAGVGAGAGAAAGYFAAGAQGGHSQYPSGREYGHTGGGTTHQSAVSSQHQQYPSAYSQYNDPYAQQANAGPIGVAIPMASPYTTATPSPVHSTSPPLRQASQHAQYYAQGQGQGQNMSPASAYSDAYGAQQQQQLHQPERSYTLGGGGYGANVVPDHSASTAYGVGATRGSPPPALMPGAGTAAAGGSYDAYAEKSASQPREPQPQQSQAQSQQYDDSPPVYEPGPGGPSVHVAEWGSKGQGFHVDSR